MLGPAQLHLSFFTPAGQIPTPRMRSRDRRARPRRRALPAGNPVLGVNFPVACARAAVLPLLCGRGDVRQRSAGTAPRVRADASGGGKVAREGGYTLGDVLPRTRASSWRGRMADCARAAAVWSVAADARTGLLAARDVEAWRGEGQGQGGVMRWW